MSMRPHLVTTLLLRILVLALLWGLAPTPARGQTSAQTSAPPPAQGGVLLNPSLAQLRPLVGRVVRITLTDGKHLQARIISAWPGVVRVTFADGRAGAVARHRIRSVMYVGARFTSLAMQDATDSGKLFTYLGLGLTFGGLLLGGAAAPPLFMAGDRFECPGILDCVPPATTAAIFITAVSASALAAGVPLWIVGAVRRSVHGRSGPAADRARRRYRSWGMGLTFTGIGLSGLGGALLAAGFTEPKDLGSLRWAGAVISPLGIFVALCIGLPMWAEAVRKRTADAADPKVQTARPSRTFSDPHHHRAWSARHSLTPPATTFAYGWRF